MVCEAKKRKKRWETRGKTDEERVSQMKIDVCIHLLLIPGCGSHTGLRLM